MTPVVLFGNSASTAMAYHQLTADPAYSVAGFTLDRDFISQNEWFGLPMVPFEEVEQYFPPDSHDMLIAIAYTSMNTLRQERYDQAIEKGFSFASYIHPTALIYPGVSFGEHCMVGPFTVIQPDAQIGNNVVIRDHCHIGHDNRIHDHCFISGHCNISGYVTLESHCFLGAGVVVKNGLTLKRSSLIGAGVTILDNTSEHDVYMNRSAQKLPFPSDRIKI
ncbi:MAG: acetyltransferase [Desulfobacteraceae bacterium]|nr:MAG: acetyltransferase [Desulfobacteraceae bacterium]